METAKVKKKISGIYCIENKINKRKYIGKSVNIRKRFYEHKRNLLNNKHTNKFLQRDFNKSGINNFVFYIISEFKESELNEKEIDYIEFYKTTNNKFGYNLTKGGEGATGYKHTKESRQKISEIQLGRRLTAEWKKNISLSHKGNIPKNINILNKIAEEKKIKILQFDLDGKFIRSWDGINECARGFNSHPTNLVKALIKKHKTFMNFIWFYEYEYNNKQIDIKDYIDNTRITSIVRLDLNRKFLREYLSINDIEEKFNRSCIFRCLRGSQKTHSGCIWVRKEDYNNDSIF